MIVTIVHIWVKPGNREEFIRATKANHAASVKEKGNLRFDFLQSIDNPGKFTLYEAYETREAANAHKETQHYKTWKESVASMMERPREGHPHQVLAPETPQQWK